MSPTLARLTGVVEKAMTPEVGSVTERRPAAFGLAWLFVALVACSSEPRPEPDLDDLLHGHKSEEAAVDAVLASKDMGELERAVGLPHHRLADALGAHRATSEITTEVRRGQISIEVLRTTTKVLFVQGGKFEATLHNDKDYGRDAIFDGTSLYLRPRFGNYHKRPPEMASEPQQILDDIASWPMAQFELLAPGMAIRTSRDEMVAGRSAIVVELELATSPRARDKERLSQRKWREGAKTTAAEGEIALDKETGAVLRYKLDGQVKYTRDGQNFEMHLSLAHQLSDIGTADAIRVPGLEETVEAPRRLEELEEREALLKGIAPPAKRGKTPDNPTGEARAPVSQ